MSLLPSMVVFYIRKRREYCTPRPFDPAQLCTHADTDCRVYCGSMDDPKDGDPKSASGRAESSVASSAGSAKEEKMRPRGLREGRRAERAAALRHRTLGPFSRMTHVRRSLGKLHGASDATPGRSGLLPSMPRLPLACQLLRARCTQRNAPSAPSRPESDLQIRPAVTMARDWGAPAAASSVVGAIAARHS